MIKKEMIAMLLAGGQGSRLGILTKEIAKPAVMFGGKYRIIDFALSNCINSGIDTVGVLTQYEPLLLTKHIGIGIPWDEHGRVRRKAVCSIQCSIRTERRRQRRLDYSVGRRSTVRSGTGRGMYTRRAY